MAALSPTALLRRPTKRPTGTVEGRALSENIFLIPASPGLQWPHARPPPKDHVRRDARLRRSRAADLLLGFPVQPLEAISDDRWPDDVRLPVLPSWPLNHHSTFKLHRGRQLRRANSQRSVCAVADPRPFFGFGEPVFPFLRCNDSTLTAHDFKSVKLAFRIHRMLLQHPFVSNLSLSLCCQARRNRAVIFLNFAGSHLK
jgi:hypothetical protein